MSHENISQNPATISSNQYLIRRRTNEGNLDEWASLVMARKDACPPKKRAASCRDKGFS